MKKIFEITDPTMIHAILDQAAYGTLAVNEGETPYAVPVNFARIGEDIYFHGALSNRKMKALRANPQVSFSVVESYAVIASFFSSTEGSACPATHFFKSVSIDGVASIVESREEKAAMFTTLMQKLQPEGGYKPFTEESYDKVLRATAVVKITPSTTRAKFKFGQHLDEERFEMIITHLQQRGTAKDLETVALMKALRE
jgi:nitroimidazol reductase NimA-like FMN-containing flavoprotein (pyridoxamine 5'-phosphate oxidase superfamily)